MVNQATSTRTKLQAQEFKFQAQEIQVFKHKLQVSSSRLKRGLKAQFPSILLKEVYITLTLKRGQRPKIFTTLTLT